MSLAPSTTQHPPGRMAGARHFAHPDVSCLVVGPGADWFDMHRDGSKFRLVPRGPLPARCTIKPVALFEHAGGFPGLCTTMGKLFFAPGATDAQTYEPFTLDPDRRFAEILLLTESTPEDELPASRIRWSNAEAPIRALVARAGFKWNGLSDDDHRELLNDAWYQPVEACALHALAAASVGRGTCMIEVGSLRGLSIAMLARGVRSVGGSEKLISVDPHGDGPHNAEYVRLALRSIGEESRLVQIVAPSDEACHSLRPGSASLIFIDGDHSRGQVLADFENYRDLLAPGGVLVFHDYGIGRHNGKPEDNPDVRPVLDGHVFTAPTFEPLLLAHTLMAFRRK